MHKADQRVVIGKLVFRREFKVMTTSVTIWEIPDFQLSILVAPKALPCLFNHLHHVRFSLSQQVFALTQNLVILSQTLIEG